MSSSSATLQPSPSSYEAPATPAVLCRGVEKRFHHYEHRTTSLRELFIRVARRRPITVRRAVFTLRDFDLRVERGEGVALIGDNGCGKSTALRLIAGVYRPTAGLVETNGRLAAVIELGVGFHPELTGVENVGLYGAVMGLSRREVAARREEVEDFAELGDFMREPVKFYSSGMQARLAFAVAVVCASPEILLLDEVLAVGDAGFQHKCRERLRLLHEQGVTIITVSHDLDSLGDICRRAVWLEHGAMRMDGDLATVVDAYRAASA